MNDSIFVIFGLTGDLSKRYLLPALYELAEMNLLPSNFRILGLTRKQTKNQEVLDQLIKTLHDKKIAANPSTLKKIDSMLGMVHMDISNDLDYEILKYALEKEDQSSGKQLTRLFYLAVPSQMFAPIVNHLGAHGLQRCGRNSEAESRLLIEKPFGHDSVSSKNLIKEIGAVFKEEQVYRVDHYLAKETVQNLLTFRFNNPFFSAVWDNKSIDFISITTAETIDIEGRVNFYEQTGALRDLIQSHLIQLLAIVCMEKPANNDSASIHKAKLALLEEISVLKPRQVKTCSVRGQYEGYKQEVNNPNSNIETFAALKLEINNKRWRGVPIILRTGKALAERVTEITVVVSDEGNPEDLNMLTFRIQPDEGIVLTLRAKKPSLQHSTETVQMKFAYKSSFTGNTQPNAYEKVLLDALRGDKTLFTTDKEVLVSWKIIENVIKKWAKNGDGLAIYQKGSWGPREADMLATKAGAKWLTRQLGI